MRLDVVTPRGRLLSVDAAEVTAPGIKGEFGVLPGHVPFLSGIKPGVLHYSGKDGSARLAIGAGYAEVSNDRVTVLADTGAASSAVVAELKAAGFVVPEINAEAARKELADAQRQLDQLVSGEPAARSVLQNQIDWAQARLDALA